MARTIWFSAYPFINKVFTPEIIYAQSVALTSEKPHHIISLISDILKPAHGYFFRGCFSDFFGLKLLQANTFSSFWTSPYENEKSSLVLGPTF